MFDGNTPSHFKKLLKPYIGTAYVKHWLHVYSTYR